ncbi:hypothetical protein [Streptomyces sp. NBC_00989]|uniref:hypothetical protein n=1 Tax=Streptomyces sp. NBC_00989 TaxID=2903705 RepID=UPI003864A03B|nr:hypothetical protein OG714_37770 [Streptomyces sp. NBC_00989]
MGIRTLHRRTAQAQAAGAAAAQGAPRPPVPAFAAGASTARIPADLAMAVRHTAAGLRRRLTFRDDTAVDPREQARHPQGPATTPTGTPVWRLWADLGRSYLDLVLTRIPRPPSAHTMTVFIATPPDSSV